MTDFGIDGCKSGWVIWSISDTDLPIFRVVSNLNDIVAEMKQGNIVIDIPIGFSDSKTPDRLCDKAARKFLSPKSRSSVFPVPCREAAYANSYQEACEINSEALGKKISKQTWNILPKVKEVDLLLKHYPKIQFRESHPEVVFTALKGAPLLYSKKKPEGIEERVHLIADFQPDWVPILTAVLSSTKKSVALADDIVDAMVLLLVATQNQNLTSMPDKLDISDTGYRREIVYWSPD